MKKYKTIYVKSHGAKIFTPFAAEYIRSFIERPETEEIKNEKGKTIYYNKVYQN